MVWASKTWFPISKFFNFYLEGLFWVAVCSLSLRSTRSLFRWEHHFKLQNVAAIDLRTQIFSWWFENFFTIKSLLERLKRDFDDSKIVSFQFTSKL